jgi:D-3-phosphoglycerate dehydrogenase
VTYRVLLTDNIAPEALSVFDEYPEIEAVRTETLPPERLAAEIGGYDAVIVRSPTRLTADILERASKLRFIGRAGVGTDNIDVEAATRLGIVVMNSTGANTVSTAEHTIALMLALARRIPQAHRSVTGGEWDRAAFRGVELWGKTLGLVGVGRVGSEVARRMKAFGMTVIAHDPYVDPRSMKEMGVELVTLETLIEKSDVVSVHVPLGPETRGLLGAREFERMKKGTMVVNCARGGVIDEAALERALARGKIACAALDVYENEPPGENPLFLYDRCVFTPHLGAATSEAQVRVATDVARAVADALTSGTIQNAVNAPAAPR